MEKVTEFFTFTSILALGGASLAALAVTNTLRRVFGWNPVSVCFAAALIICFATAYQVGKLGEISDYLVTFINSCLLFCTTTGMQEFSSQAAEPHPVGRAEPHGKSARRWFGSWLR